MKPVPPQILLIDADDTLWENNIHFERVIETVQSLLAPFGVAAHAFREQLDELERKHIAIYGYGTLNFTRSLVQACTESLPPTANPSLIRRVEELGLGIRNRPLEIIEGVTETLRYLSGRHSLHLVTKGDQEEQSGKIESSGLEAFFHSIEIVSEKSPAAYLDLAARYGWERSRTWMIGNSPRSDINPAISAGLNAVFIPHPNTWVLEHEEPVKDARVLHLERFSDLLAHF